MVSFGSTVFDGTFDGEGWKDSREKDRERMGNTCISDGVEQARALGGGRMMSLP